MMLAAMIYCVTYVSGVSAMSKNATTSPISTETPDGTTPSKELCNTALLASGYGWNNKKPLWVTEAKRRGFDIDMCNKFVGKKGLVGENANAPPIKTETPDNKTPSKELCNTALLASGYGWNNKKPLWVTEAKRRALILICVTS